MEDLFCYCARVRANPFAFAEVRRRGWGSQKSLGIPVSVGTPMVLPLHYRIPCGYQAVTKQLLQENRTPLCCNRHVLWPKRVASATDRWLRQMFMPQLL